MDPRGRSKSREKSREATESLDLHRWAMGIGRRSSVGCRPWGQGPCSSTPLLPEAASRPAVRSSTCRTCSVPTVAEEDSDGSRRSRRS
nr:unnamed protein product [Digitaria exilis]